MSDANPNPESTHTPHTPPPVPTATPVPFPAGSAPMSEKDVNEGKAFAIISYVLNFFRLPFWLVPLIMRNNEYALYHAKQCMILWLLGMVSGVICIPLAFIPCVGWVAIVVMLVGILVINVLGLINAMNGQAKPLPIIGVYAEKWFRGITKVPA